MSAHSFATYSGVTAQLAKHHWRDERVQELYRTFKYVEGGGVSWPDAPEWNAKACELFIKLGCTTKG